jgi:hypothetical protein
MTSDILRYVGVFNVKVQNTWGGGGHLRPQRFFFNVNLSEFGVPVPF